MRISRLVLSGAAIGTIAGTGLAGAQRPGHHCGGLPHRGGFTVVYDGQNATKR